jgi:hypothetical protein
MTTPPTTYRIAVIAGDGIGTEVIPAGIDVLQRAVRDEPCVLEFTAFPWGCEYYQRTGTMMSADALDQLQAFDAIYLGAVGAPGVPDHVSVWELILPIRQRFDQYVNLRPMRLLNGVPGPLAGRRVSTPGSVDACTAARRMKWPSRPACSRGVGSIALHATRFSSRPAGRIRGWRVRPRAMRCSIPWYCGMRPSMPWRPIFPPLRFASTTWMRSPRAW